MPLLPEMVHGTSIPGERVGDDDDPLPLVEVGLASEAGCGEDGSPPDSRARDWVCERDGEDGDGDADDETV